MTDSIESEITRVPESIRTGYALLLERCFPCEVVRSMKRLLEERTWETDDAGLQNAQESIHLIKRRFIDKAPLDSIANELRISEGEIIEREQWEINRLRELIRDVLKDEISCAPCKLEFESTLSALINNIKWLWHKYNVSEEDRINV